MMDKALTIVQIMAMIMYGEAAILKDGEAALAVGHVFWTRYVRACFDYWDRFSAEDMLIAYTYEHYNIHGYPPIDPPKLYMEVAHGFHAIRYVSINDVPDYYIFLAELVVTRQGYLDPTKGSYYILSWQDLQRLCGRNADKIARRAKWISKHRMIGGTMYRLYAFDKWVEDISVCREPLLLSERISNGR